MFGAPRRANATDDPATRAKMAAGDAAELKKTAETAASALSAKRAPASPSKVKALGWLEDRVNAGTDLRGVNEVVPVVECVTVPTSCYWRRKG